MSLEPRTKHMTEVVLYIHEPDSRGCVMRLRRLHTDVMRLWIHDIILMTIEIMCGLFSYQEDQGRIQDLIQGGARSVRKKNVEKGTKLRIAAGEIFFNLKDS